MRKILVVLALLLVATQVHAFNLITDLEDNTYWTVGQTAAAGTAISLKDGSISASELAEIATYRMFSTWYGGTQVSNNDGKTFTMTDTFKVGFNLNWFFSKFKHGLPDQAKWLNNIVIGPSFAIPVFSSPRVGKPFFDVNYRFGGSSVPAPQTTPQPTAESPTAPLEHNTGVGGF